MDWRERWDLTPKEAVRLQRRLRDQVHTDFQFGRPATVGGVDVAYLKASGQSVASAVVLSFPELELRERAVARIDTPFPYVPGLLSFREIPAILEALHKLSNLPDLIFVDGHGRAHPRRFGIASHLGLWLDHPTIGIGKSRLCGEYRSPGPSKGDTADLTHQKELIGRVLRSRPGVKPIFVSVGYGLGLDECVGWTLRVTPRFKLPEPIRAAHRICEEAKRK